MNGALISRSRIFELKALTREDIKELLHRAVTDRERGMGSYNVKADEDALDFLADMANGDARAALNAIELGVLTTERAADGNIHIDLATAQECIQKRALGYDKDGDNHYDTISAFIKSMRGSDPDAAVYYLARMIYAGEDVKFIARRIMICAAEDVGNADPQALGVAVNAALAAERLGLPEARIVLSQAATYVACAPKSNAAYEAIDKALDTVRSTKTPPVPNHTEGQPLQGRGKTGPRPGVSLRPQLPASLREAAVPPRRHGGRRVLHAHGQRLREADGRLPGIFKGTSRRRIRTADSRIHCINNVCGSFL